MNTALGLGPETVVIFNPHVRCYRPQAERFVIDCPEATYTFSGHSALILSRAQYLLDGSNQISRIAEILGFPLNKLSSVLTELIAGGALQDITPLLTARTPETFLAAYFPLCDYWARDIFISRFWESVFSGTAPRSVVLGWGLEFYHRVVGADEHNALSVNYCADEKIKQWLITHFQEEADHAVMFAEGLATTGFDLEAVIASPPLPTTRALINYLNILAMTDLMAYLGCYGVMHSPRIGQTRERIDQQFEWLKQSYDFASGLLGKIHEHAVIDIDLGHNGILLERVLRERVPLSRAVAVGILGAAQGIVKAFVNFFDGIYEYYSAPNAALPRCADH